MGGRLAARKAHGQLRLPGTDGGHASAAEVEIGCGDPVQAAHDHGHVAALERVGIVEDVESRQRSRGAGGGRRRSLVWLKGPVIFVRLKRSSACFRFFLTVICSMPTEPILQVGTKRGGVVQASRVDWSYELLEPQ